ncbi:hypothetical protein ACH5RR_032429 [Cinchona calisaya]|uniref:Reverse transcriptase zinc-binding domain-containing protein n=1 Tax=Cinchona calisaya TaxID=153742 RepID=A0ABD2YMG4_9GENT
MSAPSSEKNPGSTVESGQDLGNLLNLHFFFFLLNLPLLLPLEVAELLLSMSMIVDLELKSVAEEIGKNSYAKELWFQPPNCEYPKFKFADALMGFNYAVPSNCPFCNSMDTLEHVFIGCSFSTWIWRAFVALVGLLWVEVNFLLHKFQAWWMFSSSSANGQHCTMFWH